MTADELRRRMYGPELRVVLDPLVFPHYVHQYADKYAPEGFRVVTPGQTYSYTVGGVDARGQVYSHMGIVWRVGP